MSPCLSLCCEGVHGGKRPHGRILQVEFICLHICVSFSTSVIIQKVVIGFRWNIFEAVVHVKECSCAPILWFFTAASDGATAERQILDRMFSSFIPVTGSPCLGLLFSCHRLHSTEDPSSITLYEINKCCKRLIYIPGSLYHVPFTAWSCWLSHSNDIDVQKSALTIN